MPPISSFQMPKRSISPSPGQPSRKQRPDSSSQPERQVMTSVPPPETNAFSRSATPGFSISSIGQTSKRYFEKSDKLSITSSGTFCVHNAR